MRYLISVFPAKQWLIIMTLYDIEDFPLSLDLHWEIYIAVIFVSYTSMADLYG